MKRNNKKYIKYGLLALVIFSLIGCEKVQNIKENKVEESSAKSQIIKISSDEAKGIINSEENIIILDVRTKEEYDSGHIEDSILIPVDELENVAESELEDKNKKILIYCSKNIT